MLNNNIFELGLIVGAVQKAYEAPGFISTLFLPLKLAAVSPLYLQPALAINVRPQQQASPTAVSMQTVSVKTSCCAAIYHHFQPN